MQYDFYQTSLSKCLSLIIDYRGRTPKKLGLDWSDDGYRAISANNVKFSGLTKIDDIKFGNQELYDLWMKKEVKKGDLLLTSEAPSGQVMIWDSDEKIILSQRLYALRVNDNFDNKYLKYYIQSEMGQKEIIKNNSGSTVFGISAKTFDNIIVYHPIKDIQEKIGNLLYTIDKKIALNKQINARLEEMAKTLYDYWFVQFDFPDASGKPYKSSGGDMVFDETLKREIPKGWAATTLKDFLTIKNGKDHKLLSDGKYTVYGSGGAMRSADDYLFEGKSVLIPRKGTLNNVMYVNEAFWTVDTMFYTEMKQDFFAKYVFYSIKDIDFNKFNLGTGVPSMTSSILYSLKMIRPSDYLLKSFEDTLKPIFLKITNNENENQHLTQLRDFLLPMLMNGQISVICSGARDG